jgi:hypothetical protein
MSAQYIVHWLMGVLQSISFRGCLQDGHWHRFDLFILLSLFPFFCIVCIFSAIATMVLHQRGALGGHSCLASIREVSDIA